MIDEIAPPPPSASESFASNLLTPSRALSLFGLGASMLSIFMQQAWEIELERLQAHLFVRFERELRETGPWPASVLRYAKKCITYWGPKKGKSGRNKRRLAWGRLLERVFRTDAERATTVFKKVVLEQPKRRAELERRAQGLSEPVAGPCEPDEGGGDPTYDLCTVCQRPVEGFDHAKCEAFFDKLGGKS